MATNTPAPVAPQASPLASIGNSMGMVSSTLGIVSKVGWVSKLPGMTYAIPGLSIATGAIGLFSGVFNMARNGVTMGGVLNTLMSGVGAVMGGAALLAASAAAAAVAASAAAAAATAAAVSASMAAAAALGTSAAAGAAAAASAASAAATAATAASTAASGAASASMMSFAWAFITNPITLVVLAAIIVIAVLLAVFGPKPTPEEQGIIDANEALPLWHPGYMLVLPASVLLLSMIPGLTPTKTPTAPVSISTETLRNRLPQDSFAINGPNLTPGQAVPYGVPMLILDASGNATRIMIATKDGVDASGRPRDKVQIFDLNKKYVVTAPKNPKDVTSYIPIMIGKNPNPAALESIATQRSLLTACTSGALSPANCATAVMIAAALNKNVEVVPVN